MKIYKTTLLSVTAACLLLTLSSADRPNTNRLIIGSWGGSFQKAQREALFQPFNENHDVMAIDKEYGGSLPELLRAARRTGEHWDVVQVEEAELKVGCQDEGKYQLFKKINWDKIAHKDALIDEARSKCGVGTVKWSMIYSYNKDKFRNAAPKSWLDFWNTQKFPGKRGLRKTPKFTLEIALLAAGVPKESLYAKLSTPEGVDLAFKKLDELSSNIAWWESGEQPMQWLATNHVVLTTTYNGRASLANKDGRNYALVWKDNLSEMDFWAILKNSTKETEALSFINYVTDEAHQKKLSQLIPYSPTHQAAIKSLEDTPLKGELPTSPENAAQGLPIDTDFWLKNGKSLTKRFSKWLKNSDLSKAAQAKENIKTGK